MTADIREELLFSNAKQDQDMFRHFSLNTTSTIKETLEKIFCGYLSVLRVDYFVGRNKHIKDKHIRFSKSKDTVESKIGAMCDMWDDIKNVSYCDVDFNNEKIYIGVVTRKGVKIF